MAKSFSSFSKQNNFYSGYYSDRLSGSSSYSNNQILLGLNDGYFGNEAWKNFDRWYSVDLSQEGPSGRHYIFICRPDLNLVQKGSSSRSKQLNSKNGVSEDPYFQYLAAYYPDIISSLTAEYAITSSSLRAGAAVTGSGLGNSLYDNREGGTNMPVHSLLPFLTSRAESLQLPDYSIKTDELRQPYTRYGIPYPTSAIESMSSGDFDITFRDDKFLSVRKLFYAWVYYMDGVMRDKFTPKDKYIIYNCFDYATSIYDFVVDETGENVVWWTKYTGCFPYQVPLSDMSFNRGSDPDPKCVISFKYFMCEPLSYPTLIDFNFNSLGYRFMKTSETSMRSDAMNPRSLKFAPTYNNNPNAIYNGSFLGTNFVGRPCICADNPSGDNGHFGIKLKWLTKS